MTKKILAVDDSALMRRILSDIIEYDKRFELADSAENGLEAYDLIAADPHKYDLVILDINMPKMNGIQLMEKLNEKKIRVPILIVSTLAKEGAQETMRCLELGAFDFITKPDSFMETKSEKFKNKVVRFMCTAMSLPYSTQTPDSAAPTSGTPASQTSKTVSKENVTDSSKALEHVSSLDGPMSYAKVTSFVRRPHQSVGASAKRLVAIACSTGGPKALQMVIPKLPVNLDAPVLLVQHMPEAFTGTLALRLNELSKINVKEAEDGEIISKGNVYIAKGGKHMRLTKSGSDYKIVLSDDEARNGLRPCADIMYESLDELDFDEITCVVLTGMGSDGTRGIGRLSTRKNVYVIAQDEASSTVFGMPRMVFEAGITDEVVPLNDIADAITKVVGTR